MTDSIKLPKTKKTKFLDRAKQILPNGGNLSLCLTCGACSSVKGWGRGAGAGP